MNVINAGSSSYLTVMEKDFARLCFYLFFVYTRTLLFNQVPSCAASSIMMCICDGKRPRQLSRPYQKSQQGEWNTAWHDMAYGMACISVPSVFLSSNLTGLLAIVFQRYISFSIASFSKLDTVLYCTASSWIWKTARTPNSPAQVLLMNWYHAHSL